MPVIARHIIPIGDGVMGTKAVLIVSHSVMNILTEDYDADDPGTLKQVQSQVETSIDVYVPAGHEGRVGIPRLKRSDAEALARALTDLSE
jgi:hypothetical protein